ncbi:dTDP-glucose 4,6-dehydratase [Micromonospora sp. CB01531]|uniref:dTDP-glucose 4,6-dehydratase n=1 Tax=Micromonospora sp. CB01531 TaxID=1718947 RepID=UPI00093A44F2|nr:dTDP-glucose 4,6-dehydratase [Micromonospora sp. CB01531]OKI62379.1 dTDP-glucose 4,6-dehydratase [Micromonospora sp. CB01531]
MRLLVTGGAGFIGSNFVRRILGGAYPALDGVRVTVLDKLTYSGVMANLDPVGDDPRLRFILGDICDEDLVDELMSGHDAVVHFAAETHVDRSINQAAAFVRTNVQGTQVLLDAAVRHRPRRFVHVSTDEVYGSIAHGSWDENCPMEPNSPYAATKAAAELLVRSYHRTHNVPALVTRCSNNYGPYQFPEKIIPLFITRLMAGGSVPLYGDGQHVRDWLHVDDHCRAVAAVLSGGRPGEVYNIGGGMELTNRQLAERLLTACGAGPERICYVDDRKGHDRRYSVDTRKIRTQLGFTPRIPFDQGLAATVQWYRSRRDWWEPLRDRAEVLR